MDKEKPLKTYLKAAFLALLALAAALPAGCARVQETSESYVPISRAEIDPVSYSFASVDSTSQETSLAALGEYLTVYNESTSIQRVYVTDLNAVTRTAAELVPGRRYEAGTLSPDGTRLFVYREDPDATTEGAHCYGVVIDLATGRAAESASPMFEPGTVCWGAAGRLFTANRRVIFFSAETLTVIPSSFQITSLIENDVDGKYVLTGMVYDSSSNRYFAAVCKKPAGASELADLYRTEQMIAEIDSFGRTIATYRIGDSGTYAPVDEDSGKPLPQQMQADGSGSVSLYTSFFPEGSDIPALCWTVVDTAARSVAETGVRLRYGVLCGGTFYGCAMEPYSAWWETMTVLRYEKNAAGGWEGVPVFTQSSENRYIPMTEIRANNSYRMAVYPDGSLLLEAYHTESGYSRFVLYRIDPAGTYEVVGALPGKSSMKYMFIGIDRNGGLVYMSDI